MLPSSPIPSVLQPYLQAPPFAIWQMITPPPCVRAEREVFRYVVGIGRTSEWSTSSRVTA